MTCFAHLLRSLAPAWFLGLLTCPGSPAAQTQDDEPKFGSEAFLEDVRVIHEFYGRADGEEFGWVARKVGDLDGDGVIDFVTSAPSNADAGAGAGRIAVYSSATGTLLFEAHGRAGERYGNIVTAAGDVNADGTPDVLIGAPYAGASGSGTPGPGRIEVLSGRGGEVLLEVTGTDPGESFGLKACGVGDVNGDGHDDLAVGATGAEAGAGRVVLVSGKDGARLYVLEGESAGDRFGSALDAAPTTEPPLLIVGAMSAGERQVGRAYVYRLQENEARFAFTIDPDATSANLGQYFVTVLGDVDGDGFPDVYASDWNNAAKGPATGRVFVHSGGTGERLMTLTGRRAGEAFGTSVSDAGDVDGDGRADLIVGAWQARDGGVGAGRCSLYSADGTHLADYTSVQAGDTLGFDATGLGDVDGDGGVDFLLTSAWSSVAGTKSGRVWIVAGPLPTAERDAASDEDE